jgi:hypothetical protein
VLEAGAATIPPAAAARGRRGRRAGRRRRDLEEIADCLAGLAPAPACLLTHLLAAGAQARGTLGAAFDDVLAYAPELAASDTLVAYGDLPCA